MTLPQQNTALARPTSFYYLMCQLDRVQYLATRITVDTVQAANSMQAMHQAISANTNAWKAIKNQPFCDRILSSTGE